MNKKNNILNCKIKLIIFSLLISNNVIAEVHDYRNNDNDIQKKYKYDNGTIGINNNTTYKKINGQEYVYNYFTDNLENPLLAMKENNVNLSSCWDYAASVYKLDAWLLFAYAKTESNFKPYAINVNKNKSIDVGMMQINTVWIPILNKYGISAKDLLDPCKSIYIGAWIVAQNIKKFGYNIDGIGAYNSPGNVVIRRNYAKKVYENYNYLVKEYYLKPRIKLN